MPAFFPRFHKTEVVLKAVGMSQEQVEVHFVDFQPPLDICGEPCTQVAVTVPRAHEAPAATSEGQMQAFLLDLRPLGIAPRFVQIDQFVPDLPQILLHADVEFPTGLCGQLLSNRIVGDLQVLKVGVTNDLVHQVFANFSPAVGRGETWEPRQRSAPHSQPNGGPSDPSHGGIPPPTPVPGAPPNRYGIDRVDPDAHDVLQQDPQETGDIATPTELVRGTFVIFAPGYQHEVIHLDLPLPCSLEDTLAEVSEARVSDISVYFDCLVPARAQPHVGFASILTLPEWASAKSCCLVDSRAVDGRLFAFRFHDRLNRSSILLQLQIADQAGLQVSSPDALLEKTDFTPWRPETR